jgi:hypothetical protein
LVSTQYCSPIKVSKNNDRPQVSSSVKSDQVLSTTFIQKMDRPQLSSSVESDQVPSAIVFS